MARERSARAWRLAGRQHGIVTRRQLEGLGFNARSIEHRLAQGRLHPVGRGVYAVGWPQMTPERRWMAAILACGPDAVLSHRSAAALWRIGRERDGSIDVSVRRRRRRKRPGIRARSRPSLPERDIALRHEIPVTSPARTLVDLATELPRSRLERAVNEADKHDLIDPEALSDALRHFAGEPGVRPLRAMLDRHTFRLSDRELEVLFRQVATAAGMPPPLTKEIVHGYEVDFFWPDLALVVETDGLRYHRTPSSQSHDRKRDQTHTAAGLTTLRFTHYQVKHEARRVRWVLQRTKDRLAQQRGEL